MDAVSEPAIDTVVIMSSAQVGKTELILNTIGFHVHQDPAPMLMVQPTVEMGEAFSKDRLAPMIRDTPALRGRIKDARSRDSNNTLLHKGFPGGHVTIAGANSPASLASRPIRIALFDEVDRFPASAGTEGDPISLGVKRTATFWNRKIVQVSTPTIHGFSRIESAYEDSDQRQCWVPCPHCGDHQVLHWGQVRWEEDDERSAAYECEHCGSLWDDADRWNALRQAEWRARQPTKGTAGFHLNEMYSPWSTLQSIVKAFKKARNKPEQLKTWVNTTLGETWIEQGEVPDADRLYERREDYQIGTVPDGGLALTGGVDVHPNRLEVSVWAWGPGMESWLVEHRVIEGDPYQDHVWDELEEHITKPWPHENGGSLKILRVGIDCNYATPQVHAFCRKHGTTFTAAVRGEDGWKKAEISEPKSVDLNPGTGKKVRRGARQRSVGTWPLKRDIYRYLRLPRPSDEELEAGERYPHGYIHLPMIDQEYCRQLTAEQIITRHVKGYPRQEWKKTRERNEALDCRVYAQAIAISLGLNRLAEAGWSKLRDQAQGPKPRKTNAGKRTPPDENDDPKPEAAKAPPKTSARKRRWASARMTIR